MRKLCDFIKSRLSWINNSINFISLALAVFSLFISWDALKVTEIALEIASKGTEPIVEMNIDYNEDRINIKNKSHKYYQITNVNYGKIKCIGVMSNDEKVNCVYLPENYTTITLDHGHTVGTDMSDEDIKKYNKELSLNLNEDDGFFSKTDEINLIENSVREMCESKNCTYWDVSSYYDYYYIEIKFKDAYGNRNSLYYIYKYEYGSTWQLYKVEAQEYQNYMTEVYSDINSEKIISDLFAEGNFKGFWGSIYENYYYDVNIPIYQKVGK